MPLARGQPPQSELLQLDRGYRRPAGSPEEPDLDGLLAPERGMTAEKSLVVSGLIAKRRELAGIIDQLQRQLDQHRADLTHIDGVLRVLASDLDPETIRLLTRPCWTGSSPIESTIGTVEDAPFAARAATAPPAATMTATRRRTRSSASAGNVTGVTLFMSTLTPKRLELLSEMAPAAALAVVINPRNPNAESETKNAEAAAQQIGRELRVLTASNEREIDTAFADLAQPPGNALMIATDPLFFARRDQLATLAARYSIPTIHFHRSFPAAGGLVSYGATITEENRTAGRYTGPYPRRREAWRFADTAAQQDRASGQFQDRQGTRPDDPPIDPRARRRGYRTSSGPS